MNRDLNIELTNEDLAMDACSFYLKHERQLHEAFPWKEPTRISYRKYIEQLAPYLHRYSLWESNVEIFSEAIELLNQGREQKYAENTKKTIQSVIKDVCCFAEIYSKKIYRKPYPVSSRTVGRRQNDREGQRETTSERITRKLRTPKSLTILEELKLLRIINLHYLVSSYAMGLAILFYMGLRPGECAGLKFGDIRPLKEHPEINCLYVYSQIRTTREETNSLKTANAYRKLPIPEELNKLLIARRELVERRVGEASNCPIVTRTEASDGLKVHCNPNTFATYCKNVLRDICGSDELIDSAGKIAKAEGRPEAEATSYLLRRNLATASLAVCGLDADEAKYLLGHAIETQDEKRSDYLNPDFLYRLWQKINLRSFSAEQVKSTDNKPEANQRREQARVERVNITTEYAEAIQKTRNRSEGKTKD